MRYANRNPIIIDDGEIDDTRPWDLLAEEQEVDPKADALLYTPAAFEHIGSACLAPLQQLADLWCHPAHGKCESPIEQLMLRELLDALPKDTPIEAQVSIGPYRADFVIDGRLVVECDGRDFHSDDEQVAYDGDRDRYMEHVGFRVVRFSGRSIRRDGPGCGRHVAALLAGR